MSNCDNFSKTKKVTKCGTRLWLGTASGLTGTEQLIVRYLTNGDEIIDLSQPIIEGNDVFLDLTDPSLDFYNQYYTYFVNLSDANAYYSDGIKIDNGGEREGFIITFANAKNISGNDRLVVV